MLSKNIKKFFKIIKIAKKKKEINCIDYYTCINKKISNYSPEVILVILYLIYSARHGHSCIPKKHFVKKKIKRKNVFIKLLNIVSKNNINWFNTVISSMLCSNGTQKTPLVIDKKYIYLYKYWYSENKIIELLYQKKSKKKKNKIEYKKLIKKYCSNYIDKNQKNAVKKALIHNLFFLLGGPGTGKTNIIAYLILILIKISKKKIKIQLTAPTGKAVNKLTQSIYKILKKKNIQKNEKKMIPKEGITLHKLFKIQKETNKNNAKYIKRKKKIDILIIDESSMISLNIMEIILTCIKKKTKIIFVGDVYQLPSVETGSILKKICNFKKKKKEKKKIFFVLKKNYRFNKNSGINFLINQLKKKKIKDINKIYKKKYKDIIWKNLNTSNDYLNMLKKIKLYYKKYWNYVNKKKNPKKIIHKFNKYRILCIINKGIFGTKKINQYLDNYFIKINNKKKKKEFWYHGKPIIIKKNNIFLKLMNGDIGICLYKKKKKKIYFLLSTGKIKKFNPEILFHYKTAWSTTIHKSQGSEFLSVNIIIPNYFSNKFSKELFYTAISRAQKKVTIYANKKILNKIINNNKERYSGLKKKIEELNIFS
ncbi:exodeoxyribonuclease V subunit alpha [Buchnera aphidicola]|uniref:RecBCD enzyme subunit RecD n=1 Tax=Buchnera aphidicola subsp. Cinara cedri (strain Cc) TaxID=372461 RepID=Q057F4_BUCCC|nr:exodeoxyribonuclease V subunit alpha [Buchnera aphidicola]ABJ90745.1 exodeoxyribonuclease V, a chain [Buchnera aphidicola BCc]